MSQNDNNKMGLFSIILLGINVIIGSGIFLLPGQVFAIAGNASVFVYIFITGIVLAIAWCFAKCSSLFTQNGGAYLYAKEAFGDFIGFEIGIMRWMIGVTAWACLIAGFITALGIVWPNILIEPNRTLLIITIIGSLGLLNIVGGVRALKYLNNLVAIAKLFPILLFVVVGFFHMNYENFAPQSTLDWDAQTLGSCALMIFYAFGGFESLAVAAEDMKNPKKNLPIAIMSVISLCSFLYIILQVISIGMLGSALNESVAPIADAAFDIYGKIGQWVIVIAMLISIGGVNISASFITPRSAVALAEDKMIPDWIARKGRFDTPFWAILLTMMMTIGVALSGSFTQLVAISVVARFAQYASTCIALMVFYKRGMIQASSKKPFHYFGIPIIGLCGLFWLLTHATTFQILLGIGGLVLGLPLYFFRDKTKEKKEFSQQLNIDQSNKLLKSH